MLFMSGKMNRLTKIPLVGSTVGERHCFGWGQDGTGELLAQSMVTGSGAWTPQHFIASVTKSPQPLENSQSQNPVGLSTHCPLGVY